MLLAFTYLFTGKKKLVVFQLREAEHAPQRSTSPLRVFISQHDTSDAIISTVRNFYGMRGAGLSIEEVQGITIIPTYQNLRDHMVVWVRATSRGTNIGSLYQGQELESNHCRTSAISVSSSKLEVRNQLCPQPGAGTATVAGATQGQGNSQIRKVCDISSILV